MGYKIDIRGHEEVDQAINEKEYEDALIEAVRAFVATLTGVNIALVWTPRNGTVNLSGEA